MIKRGCHCGRVTFESAGRVLRFVNCHCDDCRKVSGAAFSSSLGVESGGFRITSGENHLAAYESSLENSNGWKIVKWSSEPDRTNSISVVTDILKNASAVLVSNLPATPPDNVWTNTSTNGLFEVYKVNVHW